MVHAADFVEEPTVFGAEGGDDGIFTVSSTASEVRAGDRVPLGVVVRVRLRIRRQWLVA
jgi:hypothetical protein